MNNHASKIFCTICDTFVSVFYISFSKIIFFLNSLLFVCLYFDHSSFSLIVAYTFAQPSYSIDNITGSFRIPLNVDKIILHSAAVLKNKTEMKLFQFYAKLQHK